MGHEVLLIIRNYVEGYLTVLTEIAYPDVLDEKHPGQKLEGSKIFETLIPGICENIAQIIFNETFGKVSSGSSGLQAIRIRTIMEEKYTPVKPIIGDARFEQYVDFKDKITRWKQKGYTEDLIRKKFVESVVSGYLTASKRDPIVFRDELFPAIRQAFRNYIKTNYPSIMDISNELLDFIVTKFLKRMDKGRGTILAKNLYHDLQMYCLIIHFLNQFDQLHTFLEKREIMPLMKVIRNEFEQIIDQLQDIDDVRKKIDSSILRTFRAG